jgi:hypothetical protein
MMVIVAVVVVPTESNTFKVTVPAETLAGNVTVIGEPVQTPFPAVVLKAFDGSVEVVTYEPVPPVIVKSSVCATPELTTLTVFGVMRRGFGPEMVRVAATVVPLLSLTVRATVLAAVPAGTVTTKVPPLAATAHVPVPGVPLKAIAGLADVTVYPGMPPKIVKVAVPPVTPLMLWLPGWTDSAGPPVTVRVAVTVAPTASLTVRVTEPPGEPAGTVTTKVSPLAATDHVPVPGVPLKPREGLFEVTVYPGTPPKIVKVAVPPVAPLMVWVPGCTESVEFTRMSVVLSTVPTFALTVQVPGREGAVKVAAGLVTPPTVWAKGVIEPQGVVGSPAL